MNDWQRGFLQKLESAKKQWLHRFEQFAADCIDSCAGRFDDFAAKNGFRVTQPSCEAGNRLFKFALTENGYVLIRFSMKGLEEAEASAELFIPGLGCLEPIDRTTNFCDAGEPWVEAQFQNALDAFITHFGEAGASPANQGGELITA